MKTRLLALSICLVMFAFVGSFLWAVMRPPGAAQTSASGAAPTASISELLPGGRLDMQVYALGNRDVRIEIRFIPDAGPAEQPGLTPDVNLAMVKMHMDGISPPLEQVGAGAWRINLKLPMAGQWVVSVGFAEEFAEVQFDAF
ncbi:MAG: hypothetical protein V4712_17130 [Pseudomonadota bacterium]